MKSLIKKISILFILIFIGLPAFNADAKLKPMSEKDLENIKGQAGIITGLEELTGFETIITKDLIAIGDDSSDGGWVSFSNFKMDGFIGLQKNDPSYKFNLISPDTFQIEMDNLDIIDIKSLETDILIGSSPGSGNSLGSLHIKDFKTSVSGKITISIK